LGWEKHADPTTGSRRAAGRLKSHKKGRGEDFRPETLAKREIDKSSAGEDHRVLQAIMACEGRVSQAKEGGRKL